MKTNIVDNTCTIHGVALEILGYGVLITGPSGIGKSDLLLELVSRGHKFLADDLVKVKLQDSKAFLLRESEPFMHIREVGFVNIAKIYGSNHVTNESQLTMIVELNNLSHVENRAIDSFHSWTKFGEATIRTFSLSFVNNRPLATLIELLVKYQEDLINGYDSHQEFLRYQNKMLDEVEICN